MSVILDISNHGIDLPIPFQKLLKFLITFNFTWFLNFYLKPDLFTLQARRFGVRAAMPGFIARKLCPELIFVPVDFKKYTYYSDLTRKG